MGYSVFSDSFFFFCILECRIEFSMSTPKFMPHYHHGFTKNPSFVYILFQYFLPSSSNPKLSLLLHSKIPIMAYFMNVFLFHCSYACLHTCVYIYIYKYIVLCVYLYVQKWLFVRNFILFLILKLRIMF